VKFDRNNRCQQLIELSITFSLISSTSLGIDLRSVGGFFSSDLTVEVTQHVTTPALPIADTSAVCDIGGAQLDDDARAWRRPQIEPRQYHILHCIPNSQVRVCY
jgi:hypothetical protein